MLLIILSVVLVVNGANCPSTILSTGTSCTTVAIASGCTNYGRFEYNTTTGDISYGPIACILEYTGTRCIEGPSCEPSCTLYKTQPPYPPGTPPPYDCSMWSLGTPGYNFYYTAACNVQYAWDNGFDAYWCYWNLTTGNCVNGPACHYW
jgi:hypothetical protein